MKGGSSNSDYKQQGGRTDMDEFDKLKQEEEPHLSGAYIRSLVKQLTSSSSRIKDVNISVRKTEEEGGGNRSKLPEAQLLHQNPHPRTHPKKQVRRRLHTSRPYQERLLNMAEARKEIVAALKFHREAMRQLQPPPPAPAPPQILISKSVEKERDYVMLDKYFPYSSNHDDYSYYPPPLPPPNQYQSPWTMSLPNQTLGLNLNIQDFSNLETDLNFYHKGDAASPPILCPPSSSSPSSLPSSCSSLSCTTGHTNGRGGDRDSGGGGGRGGDLYLHPALDDDEMAELRSIGEQHQIEWNDTLNLVTSAWWFNFLHTTELKLGAEDDQAFEFPAWLSANECSKDHFFPTVSEESLHDPALPW
ncbi:hypothetical protein Nepgr_001096 [Nepenthes gracilis]|uniref:Hydroxyproline-rich glycoprotein family protein n=1 Tax=Nepenthes gracilis TaxID=150966 RepID=A0AAD3P7Z0_NEPGR|nr:hypothetical protein Nepgr_001096 [Nepenthes gracilis]